MTKDEGEYAMVWGFYAAQKKFYDYEPEVLDDLTVALLADKKRWEARHGYATGESD